jgi:phage tail tape-measure protein
LIPVMEVGAEAGAEAGLPLGPLGIAGGALIGAGVAAAIESSIHGPQQANPPEDPRDRVDDPEAKEEHAAYKRRAGQTPPPELDKCEQLRWELKREQDVLEAMQQWDAKWIPGRHSIAIQQRQNLLKDLGVDLKMSVARIVLNA